MTTELDSINESLELEPFMKMSKDLKASAKLLGRRQIKYLVDSYYKAQENRIRAAAQIRAAEEAGEPNALLEWNSENHRKFEKNFQSAMGTWAQEYTVGRWLQSICGIGPVISAGLLSHLEMEPWRCAKTKDGEKPCKPSEPHGPDCKRGVCSTAGHFWSFAGMNPTVKWEKGKRRPWNADLKVLAVFKLGECFVKVQANKNDYYGHLFRTKRDELDIINDRAGNKDKCVYILTGKCPKCNGTGLRDYLNKNNKPMKCGICYGFPSVTPKKFGENPTRKCYESGKLPDAHLHAITRRWTIQLFLSHLHEVMHVNYYGKPPPNPYVFDHIPGNHSHKLEPPNFPFTDTAKSLREMRD